jgi:UDP-N-acetylmuramyl pentapeptide phosphotransferase/UDP-N-acetylglucosamine-1-phosphate transferase
VTSPRILFVLPILAMILGVVFVGTVRRYAIHSAIIDRPDYRSSHTVPTPTGGGLGLVLAVLVAWMIDAWIPGLAVGIAVLGIGVVVVVGWLDDRAPMQVGPRLAAHLVAGFCLLPLALQAQSVPAWMGWGAVAWWISWGVSSVNVVNFMDGIDGLVGSQMLLYGVHLAVLGEYNGLARSLGLALAGACAGFLLWNWAPARIFMGDVGSGALGLTVVLGGILLLREGRAGLIPAFLPLYPLFLDATITILRRAARGERLTEAHRQHLYQRLANGGWGHSKVTLLYILCAGPGVALAAASQHRLWTVMLVGYGGLVLVVGFLLDRRVLFSDPLPA